MHDDRSPRNVRSRMARQGATPPNGRVGTMRRRAGRRAYVALVVGAALAAATPATAQPGRLAGLDAYVRETMKTWEVPGIAIAVVRNDSVIYAQGYGVREIGRDEPVTPETTFAIGSASKAFTATALGILVDEGKVSWDAPALDYLPWFQVADPWVTRELTVRDLLTHRSGLGREDLVWYGSEMSRRDLLDRAARLGQEKSLRSGFLYNNIAFVAAGEIIPAVTELSWDEFVTTRLLQPLGMRSSTTSVAPLASRANVARPHAKIDDRVVPVPYRNIDVAGAAGSINSSALEMANWVRFNLGDGTFAGRRILEHATLEEVHDPVFLIDDPLFRLLGDAADANFMTYALGWAVQDFEGEKLVWHGGNIDGMSAMVGFVPAHGTGAVVLTNMNQSLLCMALMLRIIDQLSGGEPVDWAARYLEKVRELEEQGAKQLADREAARVSGTRPSLALDAYAGSYRDDLYGEATVEVRDGRLRLRIGAAFAGTLEHWHYDTFRATWDDPLMGKTFVTFDLNARGEVESVNVEGQTRFRRAPADGARQGREGVRLARFRRRVPIPRTRIPQPDGTGDCAAQPPRG